MGAFALPTLPALPSFPTIRSFINTSPPLIYPSPSNSTTRATDSPNNTPTRHRTTSPPRTLVFPSSSKEGHLDWERVDRSRRGSVASVGSHRDPTGIGAGHTTSAAQLSGRGSPVRPTHRRAQSALPRRPNPSPMGRLHEVSRNPLASSSAISLPTLCELEGGADHPRAVPFPDTSGDSAPASPLTVPRTRRISTPTPIVSLEPVDPFSLDALPPSPSPLAPHRGRAISRSVTSVPPPNPSVAFPSSTGSSTCSSSQRSRGEHGSIIMGENRPVENGRIKGLMRPPPSPRSWSAQDIRVLRLSNGPCDVQGLHRRSSVSSTSSLSDVEVLATWSFPSQPSASMARNVHGANVLGGQNQSSDKLRDRLKRLSMITTSLPISNSSSSLSASTSSLPGPEPRLARPSPGRTPTTSTNKTPTGNRHRHSHSSPNLLPLLPVSLSGPISTGRGRTAQPLLPPPGPQRRPTTSRLRQPNPLCMPVDDGIPMEKGQNNVFTTGGAGASFGSSPGSQFSDSRSTTGSDGEIMSSPNESVVSLPSVPVLPSRQSERSLFGFNKWRRGSVASVTSTASAVEDVQVVGAGKGEMFMGDGGLGVHLGRAYEAEREEERYLTLDDI